MEITFSCSEDDYIACLKWQRFPQGRNFSYWFTRLWLSAGAMWLPLLLALLARGSLQDQSVWKICLIFAGLMFLLQFIICEPETTLARWVRTAYRGREGYGHFGKRTFRLLDKHMLSTSDVGEGTVDYWSLTKIGETATHIFIMQGPSGHIIPKASVVEGSLELFITQLKERIAVAEAARPAADVTEAKPAPHRDDWIAVAALTIGTTLLSAAIFLLMKTYGAGKTVSCQCDWFLWAGPLLGLPLIGFSIYRFFFKRKRAGV